MSEESKHMPPQLAARLDFEQHRYADGAEGTEKDHKSVEMRHQEILAAKVAKAKHEVEHAKEVAAAHHAASGGRQGINVDLSKVTEADA